MKLFGSVLGEIDEGEMVAGFGADHDHVVRDIVVWGYVGEQVFERSGMIEAFRQGHLCLGCEHRDFVFVVVVFVNGDHGVFFLFHFSKTEASPFLHFSINISTVP